MGRNQIKGLAALKQYKADQDAKAAARDRPKANWFSLNKQNSVAVVRFLQELDEDADNYNSDRGLGALVVEHKSPNEDFRKQRRASCSLDDEGNCYACERHQANRKEGWGQRSNLYINVLYSFDDEEPKVGVLSRNFNSAFVQALLDEAVDENSITEANYRISRSGDGPTTAWNLKRLKTSAFDDSDAQVFDLDQTAIISIPYADQPKYYGSGEAKPVEEESKVMKDIKKEFDNEAW